MQAWGRVKRRKWAGGREGRRSLGCLCARLRLCCHATAADTAAAVDGIGAAAAPHSAAPAAAAAGALQAGDMSKAQEWKLKLEEVQRTDRKLRKEGGGYEH